MTDTRSRKRPAPFSLRLGDEERAQLERDAAGMSLGEYVRSRLFETGNAPRRTRAQFPIKDHQALGQVLGLLGQTRLASNLNQLAKLAHLGALPVETEIEAELTRACRDVALMRDLLLQALRKDAAVR